MIVLAAIAIKSFALSKASQRSEYEIYACRKCGHTENKYAHPPDECAKNVSIIHGYLSHCRYVLNLLTVTY